MSKHTPGPWAQIDRVVAVVPSTHGYATWLANCAVGGNGEKEQLANARLIAAAPELLEAAIQLLRNFPTDSDLIEAGWETLEIEQAMQAHDKARAAIRKATGEQA